MRKWWFAAAVGVPTMILSYPWLVPGLRDVFTRGSAALWWLWVAMGVASLAVLVYSGGQFFTGAWEALKHRSANMHTLIAIGTGTAWIYSSVALLFPQLFPSAEMTDVYYDVTVVGHRPGRARHGHGGQGPRPDERGDREADRPGAQDRARHPRRESRSRSRSTRWWSATWSWCGPAPRSRSTA